MEARIWQDAAADYGSIELHYAETLTDPQAFYKDECLHYLTDPKKSYAEITLKMYRELA
ncbi:hypothetical protein BGX29_010258 [Mortierella sp. GBA35]|nr:hypothetical protein BGX23_000917 [Mortierella sp. AD031]KAF9092864.1 hypothetical protein BGX29_010258 [Mortierella sp. GBA35]KAG0198498.1 hypothetical protein BGX33_012308 [Mortierella sp. NVP41]